MATLTNGVGTERWFEVIKGWRIYAYVIGTKFSDLTGAPASGELDIEQNKQDLISETVHNRRDAE